MRHSLVVPPARLLRRRSWLVVAYRVAKQRESQAQIVRLPGIWQSRVEGKPEQ